MSDLTNLFADLRHGVHCWRLRRWRELYAAAAPGYSANDQRHSSELLNRTGNRSQVYSHRKLQRRLNEGREQLRAVDLHKCGGGNRRRHRRGDHEGTGNTTIQAALNSVSGATTLTVTTPGHFLVKDAGIYTQIERRGWPSEYWSGEVIQNWNQVDSVVGSTVSAEVSLQLDKMK